MAFDFKPQLLTTNQLLYIVEHAESRDEFGVDHSKKRQAIVVEVADRLRLQAVDRIDYLIKKKIEEEPKSLRDDPSRPALLAKIRLKRS